MDLYLMNYGGVDYECNCEMCRAHRLAMKGLSGADKNAGLVSDSGSSGGGVLDDDELIKGELESKGDHDREPRG